RDDPSDEYLFTATYRNCCCNKSTRKSYWHAFYEPGTCDEAGRNYPCHSNERCDISNNRRYDKKLNKTSVESNDFPRFNAKHTLMPMIKEATFELHESDAIIQSFETR